MHVSFQGERLTSGNDVFGDLNMAWTSLRQAFSLHICITSSFKDSSVCAPLTRIRKVLRYSVMLMLSWWLHTWLAVSSTLVTCVTQCRVAMPISKYLQWSSGSTRTVGLQVWCRGRESHAATLGYQDMFVVVRRWCAVAILIVYLLWTGLVPWLA